jgi:hypothetical protein
VFRATMRIGRDHVGAAVNTLVLAYAGSALRLLLLFSVAERGLADTLTTQVIAAEVVRTLVGSIGLVAAVPITTALATAVTTGCGVGSGAAEDRVIPAAGPANDHAQHPIPTGDRDGQIQRRRSPRSNGH